MAYDSVLKVDPNAAVAADVDAAVAANAGLYLWGWSVRESAGSPAVCSGKVVHGATGAGGTSVGEIGLAASTGQTVLLPKPIACPLGISIDRIAGTFDIDIYFEIAG